MNYEPNAAGGVTKFDENVYTDVALLARSAQEGMANERRHTQKKNTLLVMDCLHTFENVVNFAHNAVLNEARKF